MGFHDASGYVQAETQASAIILAELRESLEYALERIVRELGRTDFTDLLREISSAREQLRFARFHMSDGRAPDGTVLLAPTSLEA